MISELWESGLYVSWLETKVTKKSVGVHRALVQWPDGAVRDSHVKIVFGRADKPSRHLAHEAIAWIIAKALSLPVPELAGFMVLSPAQVDAAHPGHPAAEALAWVTSTEPNQPLYIHPSMEGDKHLANELRRWKEGRAACSFDEWLANVDRYPRNLLRRGEADFMLIDHDYIAGGPHWLADALADSELDEFRNVLLEQVAPPPEGDPAPRRAFGNEMLTHCETYPDAFEQCAEQLSTWALRLLDREEDSTALRQFIVTRSNFVQKLVCGRFRLLM